MPVVTDRGVDSALDDEVHRYVVRGVVGDELSAQPSIHQPPHPGGGDLDAVAVPLCHVYGDVLWVVGGLAGGWVGPVQIGHG